MKKEITFEQIISLMDAAIDLTKEDCSSIKIYVDKDLSGYYKIVIILGSISGKFYEHRYIIQYYANSKNVYFVDRDCLDCLRYDNIQINNSQEDLLFDKINALDDAWYTNSINNINNFISAYASKKW